MRLSGVCSLLLFSVISVDAQTVTVPQFSEFPASPLFTGVPAQPKLSTPLQWRYRTSIREGVQSGPNFGGHYTLVLAGCGSSCLVGAALVDAVSGQTFALPFDSVSGGIGATYLDGGSFRSDVVQFERTSNLLIVHGCLEDRRDRCGAYYYEWSRGAFKLVKKFERVKN